MIVKIGDKKYNSDEEPIMIKMTPNEKQHLYNNFIKSKANKYCIYPESKYWEDNDYKNIKEWMGIKE